MSDPVTVGPVGFRMTRRRLAQGFLTIGGLASGGAYYWQSRPAAPSLTLTARLNEGSASYVATLALAPDGMTLAAGGDQLRLYDLPSGAGRPLRDPRDDRPALEPRKQEVGDDGLLTLALAFSPDGTLLASGDHDGIVRLWDAGSGELLARLDGHRHRRVLSLDFAPDGRTLASAGDDWAVNGWDVPGRSLLWSLGRPPAQGPPYAFMNHPVGHVVGFNRDGSLLGCVDARGTAPFFLWETSSRQFQHLCDESTPIWPYRISPDALTAVGGDSDSVALWDIASGQKRVTLEPPSRESWAGVGSSFRGDGQFVAVPWNAPTRTWIRRRSDADRAVLSFLGIHPGSRRDVGIHETGTGRLCYLLEGQTTAAFARDGSKLVTADALGRISLWDARPLDRTPRA